MQHLEGLTIRQLKAVVRQMREERNNFECWASNRAFDRSVPSFERDMGWNGAKIAMQGMDQMIDQFERHIRTLEEENCKAS